MSRPMFRSIGQKVNGFFNSDSQGFHRFHNDNVTEQQPTCVASEITELANFKNGGAAGHVGNGVHGRKKSEGDGWPDGGYTGIFEAGQEEDDANQKKNRNRISAWQAGWNVTNAIQVCSSLSSILCQRLWWRRGNASPI